MTPVTPGPLLTARITILGILIEHQNTRDTDHSRDSLALIVQGPMNNTLECKTRGDK